VARTARGGGQALRQAPLVAWRAAPPRTSMTTMRLSACSRSSCSHRSQFKKDCRLVMS
jgi:hypothetical protein